MRNRAERRKNDWRAIKRKAAIIRSVWGESDPQFNEKNLSTKPSIKDKRKIEALDFEDYDEIG